MGGCRSLSETIPFVPPSYMLNSIIMWDTDTAPIPSGWYLCDGNNGTPDLTDRFILGAGDTFANGDQGGSTSHDHTFTGDGHIHGSGGSPVCEFGTDVQTRQASEPAVGTTDLKFGRNPYYTLCFIMRKA